MPINRLIQTVTSQCPDVEEAVVRDFVSRMDSDYFDRFPPGDIARHIQLAAQLTPEEPCQVAITEDPEGPWDIVVVAYDYFSEFAGICGLLSAFGLDIREGSIYTFAESAEGAPALRSPEGPVRRRSRVKPGLSRKKIVDLFRVRPLPDLSFTPDDQRRFIHELQDLIRLLDAQRYQEARNRVNRRLVETLDRAKGTFTGLLQPVQVRFDNHLSPHDTVMDIRSVDTPAFLYAFANALTMRGLYIRKARFEHVGTELRDRFYVRNRHGAKLQDSAEQQELRVTAVLIKQFTHFLTSAPDPAKAIEYFDRFLDRTLTDLRGGKAPAFLRDKKTLTLLARLLGTSDFLWEDFLRRQHANLLPMLGEYREGPLIRPRSRLERDLRRRIGRARNDDLRRRALNQFKDEEMFRIDMKHLLDSATTLQEFSRALTDLAEVVVGQAVSDCQAKLVRAHGAPRLANGTACPFSVFGLGKFGGRELGYASDIEVLFVYGGAGHTAGRRSLSNSEFFERVTQTLLQWIEAKQEGIFHLDVRLRPHGGKGLLANAVEEIRKYYSPSGLSAPFERQAMIKLRYVAGDERLGREVETHRDGFVYSDQPWDMATALDLRRRQVKELAEPGSTNVKYSPGGLIDIEYAVQYLQLMHGRANPRLRTPNTVEALTALGASGILTAAESTSMQEAYLFLRTLIDGLRIVRGNAKDLVLPPSESDELIFLARRLGYTREQWEEGARSLASDIARHMTSTRETFKRRFGNI